ncbi:hypothetical protein [Brevibacterium permense]|uniref:hypothetical protein n=1 Tax=Brevibacterium permense TaxID=234834 RepID=UPI0021CE4E28|nr:hypothetical protein [Brevibacterium permense]
MTDSLRWQRNTIGDESELVGCTAEGAGWYGALANAADRSELNDVGVKRPDQVRQLTVLCTAGMQKVILDINQA